MTTPDDTLDADLTDLADHRRAAEELQDRLRRERQTAEALRAYLLGKHDRSV
jgi:hypothetical protein